MPTLKTLAGLAALALAGTAPTTAQLAQDTGIAGQQPFAAAAGFGPLDAVDLLVAGNVRFAQGRPEHRNAGLHRLADTAGGERPIATILAGADSRVPVERLFDRGVGDLFTVRVMGNLVGPETAGSIEYGVDALHTPVVVILGHRGCGAVRAAMNPSSVGGALRPMIDRIAPAVEQARTARGNGPAVADEAVRINVFNQVETLIAQSPSIASAVNSGSLIVTGAVYDIETGRIDWLGEHPDQDAIIASAGNSAPDVVGTPQFGQGQPVAAPIAQTNQAAQPIRRVAGQQAPQRRIITNAPGQAQNAQSQNTPAQTLQPIIRPFTAAQRDAQAQQQTTTAPRRRFVNVPTRDE
ncbi:MAG: carbonic anhydrase [Planctomycetota bacterium]